MHLLIHLYTVNRSRVGACKPRTDGMCEDGNTTVLNDRSLCLFSYLTMKGKTWSTTAAVVVVGVVAVVVVTTITTTTPYSNNNNNNKNIEI